MIEQRILIWIAAFITILFTPACKPNSDNVGNTDDILVKVGESTLTNADLVSAMPSRLSARDSISFADNFIRQWINNRIFYNVAEKNIPDLEQIDRLVSQYRQQLIIFEYQKQLISEKLDKEISEPDIENFYNENVDKFKLNSSIIKGLFLKIPENDPQINQVRKWYRSNTPQNIENIEKYSLKGAIIYEYFFDRWVSFDEVMENIPYGVQNEIDFLKTHKNLEVNEGGFYYLLNIDDYLLKGEKEPFDFARRQIRDILINKRKMQFFKDFEKDLYNRALEKGQITFYNWSDTLK